MRIRVSSRRGIVRIDGGGGVEFQVVPQSTLDDVRAGRLDQMLPSIQCETFAHDLETLLDKYGIPHYAIEIET